MSIRPENLTLDKLLQGRLFRIPDYQRTYSWETKQRKDLFQDIDKLAKHRDQERHHFMSTIVCLKTGKKEELDADEFNVFSIVDGQQRLTTLIILLKALSKELLEGSDSEKKQGTKLKELLVKEESERLILLQTNHDGKHLFRKYLQHGEIPRDETATTSADKNIISAFIECETFVKEEWKDNLTNLLKLLKNRLDFIFYVLEDEGAVHSTFEILNSRGLEVDWLDKCKSILMGIAFENLDSEAHIERSKELCEYWSQIYKAIGLKKVSGEEILRFASTFESKDKLSTFYSAEESINIFRDKCQKDNSYILKISQLFLDISKYLEQINSNIRIKAVTKISHARFLTLSIEMNKNFDDGQKKILLKKSENVTFRIFGLCRKDARTKKGEYIRLALEISNFGKEIDFTTLSNKVDELGQGDYSPQKAAEQLKDKNCYEKWTNELVYFLRRYEEYLCSNQGCQISEEIWEQVWRASASSTIEHIHPQTYDQAWQEKFGKKKDYVAKQVQRLGNLTLLPPNINSKIKNKPFKDKKEIYQQHIQLRLLVEIIEKDDWNLETLEQREEKLIQWAITEWK